MSNKTRPARVDADGTAIPYTKLVGYVRPGKNNLPHNVEKYELQHQNPHLDIACPGTCAETVRHCNCKR